MILLTMAYINNVRLIAMQLKASKVGGTSIARVPENCKVGRLLGGFAPVRSLATTSTTIHDGVAWHVVGCFVQDGLHSKYSRTSVTPTALRISAATFEYETQQSPEISCEALALIFGSRGAVCSNRQCALLSGSEPAAYCSIRYRQTIIH